MSDLLKLDNFPEFNLLEKTELSADVAAAATTFTVKNADGFTDANGVEDIIVLGPPGNDASEKKTIVTISSQTITVAALDFVHKKFAEVTSLRGDQIRVYRAANVDGTLPTDANFSLLATVTIEVDQTYTEYEDTTGGEDYWYKQTFYHSLKTDETSLSDAVGKRGGGFGNLVTVDQVRKTAGFVDNQNVTDAMIDEARDDAENTVKGAILSAGYVLPIGAPVPGAVVRMARQLAAAFLLQEEYGTAAQGSGKDGFEMEDRIMERLNGIQEGKVTLVDLHTEAEENKGDAVRGWPDDTTKDASETDAGGTRSFTKKQEW